MQPDDLARAKARLKALRRAFADRFDAGERGEALAAGLCREVDGLLCDWWREHAPAAAACVDVIAVGGYGRGELAPHSDWDVWFLLPERCGEAVEEALRGFLQFLWDAGAKVGQAVRHADETLAHVREDWDSATAALEARHLAGPGGEWRRLRQGLDRFFRRRKRAFVAAKLREVEARHARTGGTAFLMEPDIKEGKGGLRDVQAVFWMARAWYGDGQGDMEALVRQGALTAREREHLAGARDFLLRCRFGLHIGRRRPSDRLDFESQMMLAERMGYRDESGRRGVEVFMKDYFRHAGRIARVSGLLFMHFHEVLHPRRFAVRRDIGDGFVLEGDRVGLRDEGVFREDPMRLLRIFHVGQQGRRYLSSQALRRIRADVELIDEVRDDPRAHELFLAILRSKRNVRWALKEMNDTGVLGRFIPEFRDVVGLSQFNRYHAYTVDEHTIRAIGEARNFWHRERAVRLDLASEVCHKIHRPELLYIALLFHDIAKGKPGDHSVEGAKMVRAFAQRIGLNRDAVELVEWLVREHLLMAVKSQRFDLSDPAVIESFAERVGDIGRLNYLLLLTVADIAAVGPNVWNDWKGTLLRELYESTASCFMNRGAFGEEAARRRRTRIETTVELLGGDARAAVWLARLPHACVMHFPPVQLAEIVRALIDAGDDGADVRLWV
ncbi:MAG: [protein-PII] uridylyltransferase, partial [Mariprofundaceae bacterium]